MGSVSDAAHPLLPCLVTHSPSCPRRSGWCRRAKRHVHLAVLVVAQHAPRRIERVAARQRAEVVQATAQPGESHVTPAQHLAAIGVRTQDGDGGDGRRRFRHGGDVLGHPLRLDPLRRGAVDALGPVPLPAGRNPCAALEHGLYLQRPQGLRMESRHLQLVLRQQGGWTPPARRPPRCRHRASRDNAPPRAAPGQLCRGHDSQQQPASCAVWPPSGPLGTAS